MSSGRPVLLLDDLLVALRTARAAQHQAISCSIDPRPEGLTRLRSYANSLRAGIDPRVAMANIEQALGPQVISVTGVPETSHFARVMVAADYRMKRLAMNFEPSPVPGLPSYLSMMKGGGRGMPNMLPRWWLEPRYESVMQSPDGLAWEFDGASVKAMTEEDFLAANGDRQHTGKSSPLAQRWADNMTEHYEALALADPIFGQLRNCMETGHRLGADRSRGPDRQGRLQHAHAVGPDRRRDRAIPRPQAGRHAGERAQEGQHVAHQRLGRRPDQLLRRDPRRQAERHAGPAACPSRHPGGRHLVVELSAWRATLRRGRAYPDMEGLGLTWRATLRRGRRACDCYRGHDGAWPSIWSLLVEVVDRFAAVAGDQVHVERRVDAVRDASDAARRRAGG